MRMPLLLLMLIPALSCFAQISFEPGYFINNQKDSVNCFIRNVDWQSNPTSFEYKLSETGAVLNASTASVASFGIGSYTKYVRTIVDIDQSSENLSQLSRKRNPEFKSDTVFLKTMLEGNASLYLYQKANQIKFFYNISGTPIQQLISKTYRDNDNNVKTNNAFRQQLKNDFSSPSAEAAAIDRLSYKYNDLKRIFISYNKRVGSITDLYERQKEKGSSFNLAIRPGISLSSFEINNRVTDINDTDFGSTIGFRIGLEAEFILPFNKNKWSIFLEPTFHSSSHEAEITQFSGLPQTVTTDYQTIELPLGVRYYAFLNKRDKLFINALLTFDFPLSSTIDFGQTSVLELSSQTNLGIGGGITINDKLSFEIRYHVDREVLSNFPAWNSSYNSLTFIAGYKIN